MMLHRWRQELRKLVSVTAQSRLGMCAELDLYLFHHPLSAEASSPTSEGSRHGQASKTGAKVRRSGHERGPWKYKTIEDFQESTSRTQRASRRGGGDGPFSAEGPHFGESSANQNRRVRRTRRGNDILPKLGIYEVVAALLILEKRN